MKKKSNITAEEWLKREEERAERRYARMDRFMDTAPTISLIIAGIALVFAVLTVVVTLVGILLIG